MRLILKRITGGKDGGRHEKKGKGTSQWGAASPLTGWMAKKNRSIVENYEFRNTRCAENSTISAEHA